MTESRGAREQLIDAMARASAEAWRAGSWDELPESGEGSRDDYREEVAPLLDALLAEREAVPCETCAGTGEVVHEVRNVRTDALEYHPDSCTPCSGRGSTEGPPLVLGLVDADTETAADRIRDGRGAGYPPLSPGATK